MASRLKPRPSPSGSRGQASEPDCLLSECSAVETQLLPLRRPWPSASRTYGQATKVEAVAKRKSWSGDRSKGPSPGGSRSQSPLPKKKKPYPNTPKPSLNTTEPKPLPHKTSPTPTPREPKTPLPPFFLPPPSPRSPHEAEARAAATGRGREGVWVPSEKRQKMSPT